MEQPGANTTAEGRPYRSHRFPACSSCKKRKIRCTVDSPTQPCRYCRQQQRACDHGFDAQSSSVQGQQLRKTPVSHRQVSAGTRASRPIVQSSTAACNALENAHHLNDSSPLMVNPTMAEDVDILERHPLAQAGGESSHSRPYIRISNTRGESIVYRSVPRQREGLQKLSRSGVAQREIMEQVLGTLRTLVLAL